MKYREVAGKLTVLGCHELSRKSGARIANGSIPATNKPPSFRIGVAATSSSERFVRQFGNWELIGKIFKTPNQHIGHQTKDREGFSSNWQC